MASTLEGAQNMLVCEFCDIETKIIGKCLDCSLLLCIKCSDKLHSKLKQAAHHTIVKLKDLSDHSQKVSNTLKFKFTKCKMHISQMYCLYCNTCEALVCPSCIPSSHQCHNLGEIEPTIKEKIEDNENLKTELEMSLSQKIGTLKEARNIQELNFKEVKDKIKKEEDRLILHIKDKTCRDLKTLEKKWKLDDKTLLDEETSLNVKLTELLDISKSIQSEIEKGGLVNIVSLMNTTKTLQNTLILNDCLDSDNQLIDFIPGNADLAKTPTRFGSLISIRKTKYLRPPFDPYCMTLTKNGNIWITDEHEIVECNPCDKMGIVRRTYCDCQEIGCSNSSEIFVLNGHEVMKIHASGRLNVIHNFDPYIPTTFHVSVANELIVIMDSNENNTSKIVILTMDGKIKQEYNFSEFVIFDCNSIVKTIDGLFCLSSQKTLGNSLRTVKMINTYREVIWEYPLNSSTDGLRPSEITESCEGNIIMTEVTYSALHILDKAGQVLKIVSTLQFGIQNPALIASDYNGNLWINGNCNKRGNPILCILEITGF